MTNDSSIWIPTHSGRRVDIMNPNPDDIILEDIAHHLANINRYLGITSRPYSVAEHSVRLVRACGSPHMDWAGREALMHDAHEAYIGDLPRMIVHAIGSDYANMRLRVDDVIRRRFNMYSSMPLDVQEMDRAICRLEIQKLHRYPAAALRYDGNGKESDAIRAQIRLQGFDRGWFGRQRPWGWNWKYAKQAFLDMAHECQVA